MYIVLDISKKTVVGVCKDKEGNEIWEETFATTKEGLDKLIKKVYKTSILKVEHENRSKSRRCHDKRSHHTPSE
ncbi:hypothetical protein HY570_04070 [Candidatus Micrarchaeota archaeon]|nr:hypothetical protein [Candidatus Micrarchaeota archaeon]